MKRLTYNLNLRSDLQNLYWEYAMNKMFDCLATLYKTDNEVEALPVDEYSMLRRKDTMHAVKDSLYEILTVSCNEHILDCVFDALCSGIPKEVEEKYFALMAVLKIVYGQIGDTNSHRYGVFMANVMRKWETSGVDLGIKAKMFFDREVNQLRVNAV